MHSQSQGNEPHSKGRCPSYGLLTITRAYNLHEISLEEWIAQSRAWALAILEQQSPMSRKPQKQAVER